MAFERRFVNLAVNVSDLVMDRNTDPDEIVSHLLSRKISTELPLEDFLDQSVKFFGEFHEVIHAACDEWKSNPLSAIHPQASDVFLGLGEYWSLYDQFCTDTICDQLEFAWATSQRPAPTTLPYALTIELSHGKPSAVCQPEDCHRVEVQTSFCTGPLIGGTKNQTLRINNIQNSRRSDINIQIRLPGLHKGY
jgi:hypothetical protein